MEIHKRLFELRTNTEAFWRDIDSILPNIVSGDQFRQAANVLASVQAQYIEPAVTKITALVDLWASVRPL